MVFTNIQVNRQTFDWQLGKRKRDNKKVIGCHVMETSDWMSCHG